MEQYKPGGFPPASRAHAVAHTIFGGPAMTTGTQQDPSVPASRPESVTTAVGIAAERKTIAARERDLVAARAAARRLSTVSR